LLREPKDQLRAVLRTRFEALGAPGAFSKVERVEARLRRALLSALRATSAKDSNL
jgi:hypothetical protein